MRRLKLRIDKSRGPIGIDVAHRQIRATQMGRTTGGWRVEAAATFPRVAPAATIDRAEVEELRSLLNSQGFKGNSIVLAVPADKLLTGILEMPPRASGAPIEQLARAELARMHKCEAVGFEMACWDLPAPARATNSTFVMAAACTHADANELLDVFEHEGFTVKGLDIQASAAARACHPLLEDVSGIAAILDMGWASARLALLYQDVIVYERNLPKSGMASVVQALVPDFDAKMGVSEQLLAIISTDKPDTADAQVRTEDPKVRAALDAHFEVILQEMRIPLSYVANQYPDAGLDRLLLIGCGAELTGLEAHLAAKLDCPVQAVKPSDLGDAPQDVNRNYGACLTVAVGLSEFLER